MTTSGPTAADVIRFGAATGGALGLVSLVYSRVRALWRAIVWRRRNSQRVIGLLGVGVSRAYVEQQLGAAITRSNAEDQEVYIGEPAGESIYRFARLLGAN